MNQHILSLLFLACLFVFLSGCIEENNDTVENNIPVIEQTFPLGTSGATIDMIWIRPGSYWMGNTNQTQPGT
ncbi:MAG: hypothetical protein OEM52_08910, partial [bacterium]|nr:hypothetical protein [bacterium]